MSSQNQLFNRGRRIKALPSNESPPNQRRPGRTYRPPSNDPPPNEVQISDPPRIYTESTLNELNNDKELRHLYDTNPDIANLLNNSNNQSYKFSKPTRPPDDELQSQNLPPHRRRIPGGGSFKKYKRTTQHKYKNIMSYKNAKRVYNNSRHRRSRWNR